MPAFKYEALSAAGKSVTGLVEADTARAARAQLRAQALVPLDVKQIAADSGSTHSPMVRTSSNAMPVTPVMQSRAVGDSRA